MSVEDRGRYGRIVECPKCGRNKAPVGRSLPGVCVGSYCTWDSCKFYYDDGEWVVDFGVWNTGFATLREAEVFVETVARGVLVATSFTEAI